jgi:hypothetical protein
MTEGWCRRIGEFVGLTLGFLGLISKFVGLTRRFVGEIYAESGFCYEGIWFTLAVRTEMNHPCHVYEVR